MTATEELRRLLDERGVEWRKGEFPNEARTYWRDMVARPWDEQRLNVVALLTPEQAIEATLGSDALYDAGFASGVQAVFQQLEGIEDYEGLQVLIEEYWGEGEGNDAE